MNTIQKLEAAAASWVGTPFCEHSAVKGAGVCCHRAVAEVLMEAGLLPRLALPTAAPGHARANNRGVLDAWLDAEGAQWFMSCPGRVISRTLFPGDVLGFRLGRSVHHVALQLGGERIFHAIQGAGAVIAPSLPPQWAQRLTRIWQPRALI